MPDHSRALRPLAWVLFAAMAVAPWATPSSQAPTVQKDDAEYTA
jgi:hypothetical protein